MSSKVTDKVGQVFIYSIFSRSKSFVKLPLRLQNNQLALLIASTLTFSNWCSCVKKSRCRLHSPTQDCRKPPTSNHTLLFGAVLHKAPTTKKLRRTIKLVLETRNYVAMRVSVFMLGLWSCAMTEETKEILST